MKKMNRSLFLQKNDIKENGKRTERADEAQRELL